MDDIFGLDISFDLKTGLLGTKDVPAGEEDIPTVTGVTALGQELQRLFDLTPRSSFIDDLEYGHQWNSIGTALFRPTVATAATRADVVRALSHRSFSDRFKVRSVECWWDPETPNVLWVKGIIQIGATLRSLHFSRELA